MPDFMSPTPVPVVPKIILGAVRFPVRIRILTVSNIKVYWYTIRGSNSSFFHFCLRSHGGSILKEKNLLLLEQILSFKSKSCFERVGLSR